MNERQGLITFQGNPLTLLGNAVNVGGKAPDFTVLRNDLSPAALKDFLGKPLIIASVPSLDTAVCSLETNRFNKEMEQLNAPVEMLTVSMDLPFAQARWAQENGAKNVTTLSDHFAASFGEAYGVLIKELRLLARAVFVVDREGLVVHTELVAEVTNEPDYDSIIAAVKKLV